MRTVAVVLYNGFAPLDAFGPIQAFNVAFKRGEIGVNNQLYRVTTVGMERGLVHNGYSGMGAEVMVANAFDDYLRYDILLIPGGFSTRSLVQDSAFIDRLTQAASRANIVASVCTGAALLAKTGLLNGRRATTNKSAWDFVVAQGPEVDWVCSPRWVNDIDPSTQKGFITSGGVSAGTDMALGLIQFLDGETVVDKAQVIMEYQWNPDADYDPFAYLCPKAATT